MSITTRQGYFLLIVLVFALFNCDAYGMSVPETHSTLEGHLQSGCVAGAITESAAGGTGLTREEFAKLSDDQYWEYIVEHDMGSKSQRKDFMDNKQLLEEHQDETHKLALESHPHTKTSGARAVQKEIHLNINHPGDLTGKPVDVRSERVKGQLIEDTAKADGPVDKVYKVFKQIQAAYSKARSEFEDAAKNLKNPRQDPQPLTKEVSELDDEEYITEAAKYDIGVVYGLEGWRKSRGRLDLAVNHAYSSALPFMSELFPRQRESSIDKKTASTDAKMSFITPLINKAGEIRIPVLEQAIKAVRRCQEDEKLYKNAALVTADRYWMASGKISPEGKRYKGLNLYSPYDSIMAILRKLKPAVCNWFNMPHGWWNQNHTPNEMNSLAIVPDKGPKLK